MNSDLHGNIRLIPFPPQPTAPPSADPVIAAQQQLTSDVPHITPKDPAAFGAMLAQMLGGGTVTVDPTTRQITVVPAWVAEEEAAAAAESHTAAAIAAYQRAQTRKRRKTNKAAKATKQAQRR